MTAIRSIAALLLAAALLIAGNGLQSTLLAVRAELEGFPLALIGLLMSAYYVGFIVGCRRGPRLIQRVGHIRTFTALASLVSAAALVHALIAEPVLWIALRVIAGFSMAGLYMIIESWINESVDNASRGRVLAAYRIIDLSALTAGQALLAVADPASFVLFSIISIIISLALIPVALTNAATPQPITKAQLDLGKMLAASPVAAAACFSAGAANGAFWAIGPVFAQRLGYSVSEVSFFMSAVVIGGAVAQWPIGFLSDRFDRRFVIAGAALTCVGASAAMATFAGAAPIAL
ncbi:MAG: MFS transporter, partial [Pseudomonadota bacterium]